MAESIINIKLTKLEEVKELIDIVSSIPLCEHNKEVRLRLQEWLDRNINEQVIK